jgi:hypothetical protein
LRLELGEVDDLDALSFHEAFKVSFDVSSLEKDGGGRGGEMEGVLGIRCGDGRVKEQVKGGRSRSREGKRGDVVLGTGGREDLLDEVFRGETELFQVEQLADSARRRLGLLLSEDEDRRRSGRLGGLGLEEELSAISVSSNVDTKHSA